jgi:uncharacterized membrane protein
MMKKIITVIGSISAGIVLLIFSQHSFAQQAAQGLGQVPKQDFSTGKVLQIIKHGYKNFGSIKSLYQDVKVQIQDGVNKGKILTIENGGETSILPSQEVKTGDVIILMQSQLGNEKTQYFIYDKYRLLVISYIAIAFFLLVFAIAGWKGLGSLIGLAISLTIIFLYIVPQILSGSDPLTVSIIGSLAILLLTTYLAHGISKQTTVALISTFIALMFTAWLSSFFVHLANLTGMTDETSTLQFGTTSHINLQGLLLGGIIIGTLGALNDITTTQATAIFELAKHSVKISFEKLFLAGFRVGQEHIVSLVNTLVLAYAGSSLALFLFIVLNPQKIPFWVMLNNEDIADEIVRTLAGSIGLILVVPIVTVLAAGLAMWLKNNNNKLTSIKK